MSNGGNLKGSKELLKQARSSARPWTSKFWERMTHRYDEDFPKVELTPELLWELACMYFEGEKEDQVDKNDFIRSGEKAGELVVIPITRPFSWTSLDLFLISQGIRCSIREIKENRDNRFPEYVSVISEISQIISQQKFDGAAAGSYNPQLIIRDLGLAEKVDANVKTEQPLFTDLPPAPQEEDLL